MTGWVYQRSLKYIVNETRENICACKIKRSNATDRCIIASFLLIILLEYSDWGMPKDMHKTLHSLTSKDCDVLLS